MSRSVKRGISGYSFLFLVILITAALLVPVMGTENGSAMPQPTAITYRTRTIVPNSTMPVHPLGYIQNTTGQLDYWNDKMHWGLSEPQIIEYGKKLETRMLGKYQFDQKYSWFSIYNYSEYAEDVGSTIGLDDEQKLAFVYQEDDMNKYKIAFMEIPNYKPPETPHFFASGKIIDNNSRPVPGVTVRFISDLTTNGQNLSSTALSDRDGSWRIKIVWGKHQNITLTKDGYKPLTEEITFENETNVMDFKLTPQPKPAPVSPGSIVISLIFGYFVIRSRKKDG